ncbi:MAG: hypothetical protein H8D45_25740 [Bacteroidetes bacterium]|nr:hypothetical protein [Bacteroidota bacterium]MBL7102795.1 hypothetical protein [Bacteroidales bacterium]
MIIAIILIVLLFYAGFIIVNILRTENKRKNLRVGEVCKVYLGENKLTGFIMKVNSEVDVLVINKVFRFSRDQIYA